MFAVTDELEGGLQLQLNVQVSHDVPEGEALSRKSEKYFDEINVLKNNFIFILQWNFNFRERSKLYNMAR